MVLNLVQGCEKERENRPEKKEMTEKFGEGLDAKRGENAEILGKGLR